MHGLFVHRSMSSDESIHARSQQEVLQTQGLSQLCCRKYFAEHLLVWRLVCGNKLGDQHPVLHTVNEIRPMQRVGG